MYNSSTSHNTALLLGFGYDLTMTWFVLWCPLVLSLYLHQYWNVVKSRNGVREGKGGCVRGDTPSLLCQVPAKTTSNTTLLTFPCTCSVLERYRTGQVLSKDTTTAPHGQLTIDNNEIMYSGGGCFTFEEIILWGDTPYQLSISG